MTAIDDIRKWFESEREEYDPWEAKLLAAGIKELDDKFKVHNERLMRLEDKLTPAQPSLMAYRNDTPTVTDAMREAGNQTIRRYNIPLRDILRQLRVSRLREHDNSLEYIAERVFKTMWEARDDSD